MFNWCKLEKNNNLKLRYKAQVFKHLVNIKGKDSAQIVSDFLKYAINNILFIRRVYTADSVEQIYEDR